MNKGQESKIVVSMSVSLDGFFEDAGGDIGWTEPSEEVHRFHNERAARAGGFIMGRRLYEAMHPFWPDIVANPSGVPAMDEFADIWMSKPRYVFSRSLTEVTGGCELVQTDDIVKWATNIKASVEGNIDLGGPDLASTFERLGLVDQYQLMVAPVVLGSGKPFFTTTFEKSQLKLIESRVFPCDTVMLRYERNWAN